MPELLLHYIWQHCLWAEYPQLTTDGYPIEILSVGQHNQDAGPDFTNVHLRINGQEWVGNVEIHINSSDWYTHRHHLDPAYDNVVLHVVRNADKDVFNSKGQPIVQCELAYPTDKDYLSQLIVTAQEMDLPTHSMECSKQLLTDPTLLTDGWRKALLRNRFECKRKSIDQLLRITHNSWEHAFYITLARNFGFHTNGLPFETMAIQTPLSYLQKHRNSLFQLTAILLGQSGLLTAEDAATEEEQRLWNEYQFLQKKFSLKPISGTMWKRGRMRPQAFPEVRIRQFAYLLYQSEFLFSRLMEEQDIDKLRHILTLQLDKKEIAEAETNRIELPHQIGTDSIDILLINSVIPYRYAYALSHNNHIAADQALSQMENITAENNRIIRQWRMIGQEVHSAADSQALIHLYQNYCQPHHCLSCDVGYQIFAHKQLSL